MIGPPLDQSTVNHCLICNLQSGITRPRFLIYNCEAQRSGNASLVMLASMLDIISKGILAQENYGFTACHS